jgi:predicted RNA binding protein YcfA (HicA-like mRNA interferase family)
MANVREAIAGVLEVMKERVRARRFEEGERKVVSIPVHGNRDLKRGLANRIARDRY